MAGDRLKLSVVIPAHNEAGSIEETVNGIMGELEREAIDYEILVVDDASSDDTGGSCAGSAIRRVRCVRSHNPARLRVRRARRASTTSPATRWRS